MREKFPSLRFNLGNIRTKISNCFDFNIVDDIYVFLIVLPKRQGQIFKQHQSI